MHQLKGGLHGQPSKGIPSVEIVDLSVELDKLLGYVGIDDKKGAAGLQ